MFFPTDPCTGCSWIAVGDDAEIPQRVDRPMLQPSQVPMKPQFQLVEVENRVGHQLAGAVVGDVTPPIRLFHRHAGCFQSRGICKEMIGRPGTT